VGVCVPRLYELCSQKHSGSVQVVYSCVFILFIPMTRGKKHQQKVEVKKIFGGNKRAVAFPVSGKEIWNLFVYFCSPYLVVEKINIVSIYLFN
jgi:hypothetical protein